MKTTVKFKTAADFRKSLEARLQMHALKTGIDLQRLRRQVAFDRCLARIFSVENNNFFLKGGYAMELRIAQARATKDIDLTYIGRPLNDQQSLNSFILQNLQTLTIHNLNDHFEYQVGAPQMDLENAPYGGSRYPVAAFIEGRLFVRFHLDIGLDFLLDRAEIIQGSQWLEFYGISAPMISMISVEQQFAEKLHAYTQDRGKKVNSRVKDLIDMILLLNMRTTKIETLADMAKKVFGKRGTHALPQQIEKPPSEWHTQFQSMAAECELSPDMQEGFRKIAETYRRLVSVKALQD